MHDTFSSAPATLGTTVAPDDLSASIAALSTALRERDSYTQDHCDRVETLAWHLGRVLGMTDAELSDLTLAARFHDVGKIGIPDAVLLKPSRLDDHELAVMRTHSARGQRVFLSTGRENADRVGLMIREHHEAWNGSGYPDGLRGEDISLGARILAVVDGYDAMTTTRPYRTAMEYDAVMAILAEESGTRLDPSVVHVFTGMMAQHPHLRAL